MTSSELHEAFQAWTDCLLDPARAPIEHLKAARAWHDWGLCFLGIDEISPRDPENPFFADSYLAHGKAISPLGAVRCVREYRRTAVFLQAMEAALHEARRRFPGETIHVLEAGCGPLAPLALPFALRYPPTEVQFTLLDYHPVALEAVRRVVVALGLQRSIRAYVAADATTYRFPEAERPHVIACEVLLRALKREPQVAATSNLAPQLQRGGLFVPERIDVDAALFKLGRHLAASMVGDVSMAKGESAGAARLGTIFSLAAAATDRLESDRPGTYRANSVVVPPHDLPTASVQLLTRIQVFGPHRLGDFESSLNLPERISYPPEIAERGGELDFIYEASGDPGLRVVSRRAMAGR